MPRRNTPDHSYFDSVFTQLELRVVSLFSGVVSNVESNAASGIFPGLNVVDTGLKAGMAYHRFRYYSPETGAYISQDPIRLEAEADKPVYTHTRCKCLGGSARSSQSISLNVKSRIF